MSRMPQDRASSSSRGLTVDPEARIDKLTIMLGFWTAMAQVGSESGEAPPVDSTPLPPNRAGDYVDMLAARLDANREPTLELAARCRAGDDRACRWAGWLAQQAVDFLPDLRELTTASFQEQDYAVAERTATFAVGALTAVNRRAECLEWWWWAGRSAWRLDRVDAAVAHLQLAAEVEVDENTRATVCKAADLLGLALSVSHRPQDAIREHARALALVRGQADRSIVLTNQSQTLVSAGYYARAEAVASEAYHTGAQAGLEPQQLGLLRDNWSDAAEAAGDLALACALVAEAETDLSNAALHDRLVNLFKRADLALATGALDERKRAYERAYELASAAVASGLDARHYLDGYARWVQTQLPEQDPVLVHFEEGLWRRSQADYDGSAACFEAVADAATRAGDMLLRLRAAVNLASSLLEAHLLEPAGQIVRWVRDTARAQGLALMQAMAIGTLASLHAEGYEGGSELDILRLDLEALALLDVHHRVSERLGHPEVRADGLIDPGALMNTLGLQAHRYGALELAARLLRAARDSAVRFGNTQGRANRTGSLLVVLMENEGVALDGEIARLAEELQAVAVDDAIPVATRLNARLALDRWHSMTPEQLRPAADLLELLRAAQPPGAARAAVDGRHDVWPVLAGRLLDRGRVIEAWEALQHTRARELLESMTAQVGEKAPYRPPDLSEAQRLLTQLGPPTYLVDLRVAGSGVDAFVVGADGLRHVRIESDLAGRRLGWGEPLQRAADALTIVESPPFPDLVARVSEITGDADVLVCVDGAYANLPFHVIPTENGPWGRRQRVSRLPAVGLLRFRNERGHPSGSLVAGDSRGDLPGAAQECRQVAMSLGIEPLLGPDCSLSALTDLGSIELDVLHLAVHGYADPRSGSTCSLLLAGSGGGPTWVMWERLAALPWRAQLVVLSGCSTGVGGPRHGRGLYSVTSTALQSGASAVIASLWPVDDELTAVYMAAMYDDLARQRSAAALSGGTIDLRDAMRAGGAAATGAAAANPATKVRDAREFDLGELPKPARRAAHLVSAAFALVGDPIVTVPA